VRLFDDQSLPFSVLSDHLEDGRPAMVPSAAVVFFVLFSTDDGSVSVEGGAEMTA